MVNELATADTGYAFGIQRTLRASNAALRKIAADQSDEIDQLKGRDPLPIVPYPTDPEKALERIRREDPLSLTWRDLDEADAIEAGAGEALWRTIQAEAKANVDGGHRSADLLSGWGQATPAEFARYRAIRNGYIEEWQPKGMTELGIIDMMVQTRVMYEKWLQKSLGYTLRDCIESEADKDAQSVGAWVPPRISEADTLAQSTTYATRWMNQHLKLVRGLRDLRRSGITINADRVMLAQNQVNAEHMTMSQGKDAPQTFIGEGSRQ